MMRIIAGRYRSRELAAPSGEKTRPTTDRAREALFNVLTNMMTFDGAAVLDLFAGSGALAFEAMSRGAERATLVEKDRRALTIIKENANNLGVEDEMSVIAGDVFKVLERERHDSFDLVIA